VVVSEIFDVYPYSGEIIQFDFAHNFSTGLVKNHQLGINQFRPAKRSGHLFLTLDRMRRHHQWNQDTTARHFTLALAACASSKAWQGATWLLATMPLAEVRSLTPTKGKVVIS